jgi:hypothetical protein
MKLGEYRSGRWVAEGVLEMAEEISLGRLLQSIVTNLPLDLGPRP